MVAAFHMGVQATWTSICQRQGTDAYQYGTDMWMEGVNQELIFWFNYLRSGSRTKNSPHAREFSAALDIEDLLDHRLRELVMQDSSGEYTFVAPPKKVTVLDVGSGPLSVIGRAWPGVSVHIRAADALGCEYSEMRQILGISLPDPESAPQPVHAERLTHAFHSDSFDIAVCRNALDHSHDPILVIAEMLRVVRPGRPVLLQHFPNEGETGTYSGLHQWNIDLRGGRLLLWRPNHRGMQKVERDVETDMVEQGLMLPGTLWVNMIANFSTRSGPSEPIIEAVLWRSPAPL